MYILESDKTPADSATLNTKGYIKYIYKLLIEWVISGWYGLSAELWKLFNKLLNLKQIKINAGISHSIKFTTTFLSSNNDLFQKIIKNNGQMIAVSLDNIPALINKNISRDLINDIFDVLVFSSVNKNASIKKIT